jgi:acyl-CoA thioesterase I
VNPAALYLISGDSLYLGSALLLLAIGVSPYLKSRRMLSARNVAAWFAVALMVVACPPVSWIVAAITLGGFVAWFALSNMDAPTTSWTRFRGIVGAVLFLSVLALCTSGLMHRRMPSITGIPSDHLVVIGDSVSSGIDSRSPAWPTVFQQMTDARVKNLARPGATVADAQAMVDSVTPDDRVFLIEIGGNDLLSVIPSSECGRNLDLLLSRLSAPGRTIVMFELPLLPHKVAYGRIQRRLSAKYGVWLIPKHYFVAVIGSANGTLDGLHLSSSGANRMAALVAGALSSVVKSPAP